MKICLTGSDGYIGSLVKARFSQKHQLVCIDLKGGCDIATTDNIKADYLIHLAAFISVSESYTQSEKYYRENCAKYHQFLNGNHNEFKNVIYASSIAVYDEDGKINPKSVYGSTKLDGEYITKRYTDNHHILRFGNPIGLHPDIHRHVNFDKAYPNLLWTLANCCSHNKKFQLHDDPNMTRDFYPVSWIIEAIEYLIEHEDQMNFGTSNIGSGNQSNVHKIVFSICDKYDIKYKKIPPPIGTVISPNTYDFDYSLLDKTHIDRHDFDSLEYCLQSFPNYLELIK